MKRFSIFCGSVLAAFSCMAGEGPTEHPIAISSVWSNATYTASNSLPVYGYVESVFVDLPVAAYTSTVTLATDTDTLGTWVVTSDSVIYPRVKTSWTNGTAVADYVRFFLVAEKLTATVLTTYGGTTTRTVTLRVKTNDK